MGTPGWQQSTQPICDPWQGSQFAFDIWADARGVFALFSAVDGCPGDFCGSFGVSLKFNAGSGWQTLQEFSPGATGYMGWHLWPSFPGGSLLMSGPLADQAGLYFVDGSNFTFQTVPTDMMSGAFVVGSDLAYVIDGMRLLKYSAGTWSTVGEATSSLSAVWADSQSVVVVGDDQTILMQSGNSPLTALPNVPAGNYTSVWAFGASDIWTGNSIGQLVHYDGKTWKVIPTGSQIDPAIGKLWGADGIVYFITGVEMGRWNGSSVDMLLEPAGSDHSGFFFDIWGRSAQEVFVAIMDRFYMTYTCGGTFMLWFDGSQFHQF